MLPVGLPACLPACLPAYLFPCICINIMPHYIVILHALHNLSFSFTISFIFSNHRAIVEIHYNVDNNIFDV